MRVLIEKGCAAPKPVGADYPAWRVTAVFLLFTEKLKKGGSGGICWAYLKANIVVNIKMKRARRSDVN